MGFRFFSAACLFATIAVASSVVCMAGKPSCGPTEYCSGAYIDTQGVCKARNAAGQACGDHVFNGGSTCVEGLTCANSICSAGKECKAGLAGQECTTDEYCSGSWGDFTGVCKAKNEFGKNCGDTVVNGGSSCLSGHYCNQTSNVGVCAVGTECTAGSSIAGSKCIGGTGGLFSTQYCSGSWKDPKGLCKTQNMDGEPCGDVVAFGGDSCFSGRYCDAITKVCTNGTKPPICLGVGESDCAAGQYCANLGWETRCLAKKAKGAVCGDALPGSSSCQDGNFCLMEGTPPTCMNGTTSKCGVGQSCPSHQYCKAIDGIINECRPKKGENEGCDDGATFGGGDEDEICLPAFKCLKDDADKKICQRLKLEGESCNSTPLCADKLYCTKDNKGVTDGKCQKRVENGEPCSQDETRWATQTECEMSLYCTAATKAEDPVCEPEKGEGAKCTVGAECQFDCGSDNKCMSLSGIFLAILGPAVLAGIAIGGICCCAFVLGVLYIICGRGRSKGQSL